MSALGHTWRLRASNTQNQSITVTAKARYTKRDSSGAMVWSAEQTLISAASVAAATGTTASSTVDNSSDKYDGMELTLSVAASSATNGTGTLALYTERSTDGGTTWPTQDRGQWIGAYTLVSGDGTSTKLSNILVR